MTDQVKDDRLSRGGNWERGDDSNTFIHQGFKRDFIIKFCIFIVLGGCLVSGIVLYFSRNTLTTSFLDGRLVLEVTSLAVLPAVIYTNLVMIFIAVIVVVIVTRYLMHRTVMPLFIFQKKLKKLAQGDVTTRFGYRPGDLTRDLSEELNRMTEAFRSKVTSIHSGIRMAVLNNATQTIQDPLGDELAGLLEFVENEIASALPIKKGNDVG